MNYEEFKDLKEVELKETKLIKCFELSSGERFFIEPPFYTQLMSLKEIYPDDFPKVIEHMKKLAKERKYVGFVYDFENPFVHIDGFKYLEITDVTDPIHVFYEDKSRGSDYGD